MIDQVPIAVLCEMVRGYHERYRHPINERTRFKRDLKMDAVDFLDLVLRIEARFSCRLDDELLANVVNVGQLGLLLEKALAERNEK